MKNPPQSPAGSFRFRVIFFCLALAPGALPLDSVAAEDATPSGDAVLRLVRMSQALQDLSRLQGRLRISSDDQAVDGVQYPLELTMRDNVIRFLLRDPNEIINLDLNRDGSTLSRVVAGGRVEMPTSLYGEKVRKTDINYEDLSMRFLYWPGAKIVGEDSLSFQKCWHVRVMNPDGRGPYGMVDVWVAKGSGAMMQMEAYQVANQQWRKVKQFKVRKGQKYKGAYILKQMRVESFDEKGGIKGITYLEIDDPD